MGHPFSGQLFLNNPAALRIALALHLLHRLADKNRELSPYLPGIPRPARGGGDNLSTTASSAPCRLLLSPAARLRHQPLTGLPDFRKGLLGAGARHVPSRARRSSRPGAWVRAH